MAVIYPDSVITEYHDGSNWVDISDYVVSDIKGKNGFITAKPNDRLAGLGTVTLDLNNAAKKFTPYGGDAVRGLPTLTGWKKGAKIRTRVVVAGRSKTAWTGRIADIKSDDGTWGNQRVHLVCVDYVDILTKFPMKGASIGTNQTIDEAVADILARLAIQPENIDFDTGDEIFPATFSDVKDKTKAIGEINKLVMSELGYGYILKDGTLRIENSTARKGTRALDQVNQHPNTMDNLELADGDDFLLADGDTLLLEAPEDAALTYTAQEMDIETSDDLTLNSAYITAYPVRVDTSLQVLFSLGQPIAVAAGKTVHFSGRYTNPNGGNPCNGTDMQAPVSTTDYLMNSISNGSGTNLTANFTVTATYYGDQVDYSIFNGGTKLGYITKLQARGYGIYFDSPIEGTVSDSDAIDEHGDYSIILDQKYKRDTYAGLAYARSAVELLKDPKSHVVRASFDANVSEHNMMACLDLDVGSLLSLYENRSQMSKWYYIFSRAFVITLGGVLLFTYGFMEAPSIDSEGLNPVAVDFGGPPSGDAVDFGYIPQIANLPERSVSFWAYRDSTSTISVAEVFFSQMEDDAGLTVYTKANGGELGERVNLQVKTSLQQGIWQTNQNTFPGLQWHHVVVTFNSSTFAVKIYIDNVDMSVNEIVAHTGVVKDETGLKLTLGNENTLAQPLDLAFNGKIKDVRVYDRILSQAEVTELYNSGTQDYSLVRDGMLFQAFAIDSDLGDATSLAGSQIPAGHNYFENVLRNVGTPIGAPVIR